MNSPEDGIVEVTPEQVAAWNDDRDIDFYKLRSELGVEGDSSTEVDEEEENQEVGSDEEDTEQSNDDSQENSDNEGDEVDGSEGADEGQPEDQTTEGTKDVDGVETKTYKFRANDMEFEFTQEEIIEKFGEVFGKAMDYTKKTTELKPWRQTISALKENKVSQDDVNLMIEVLKGDKNAIATVLKRTGVDALEIDTDSVTDYTPKQYGMDEGTLRIHEVLDQISRDPEYVITEKVFDVQWDSASRAEMAKNPDMILGLHNDIKNGVYDKVAPMAIKMKVMDGGRKSDLDYYIAAGEQYFAAQERAKVVATEQTKLAQEEEGQKVRQQTIKAEANKRKAASVSKPTSGKKDVIDYLDDDDEAFEEWRKKLEAKY